MGNERGTKPLRLQLVFIFSFFASKLEWSQLHNERQLVKKLIFLIAAFVVAATSSTCSASLTGTYTASFLTGTSNGGAFSYIHTATRHSMLGGAGYYQKAGGTVLFAVDNRDQFTFDFADNGDVGLSSGDELSFSFDVDILEYDGSLDGNNTLLDVVGTMTIFGELQVGSATDPHSPQFDFALSNILAADENAYGLGYAINLFDNASGYEAGDSFYGDAFFQQADYIGPFNGISFDQNSQTLEFALWGDSRNTTTNNTGVYIDEVGTSDLALGFDFRVSAYQSGSPAVPEPTSIFAWSVLALGFAGSRVRSRS